MCASVEFFADLHVWHSDVHSWGDMFFFCGDTFQYCTCSLAWNVKGAQ